MIKQNIKAAGTEIFGISPDNEKSHQKFISKFNLPFSLLCDTDKTVTKMFEANGEKKCTAKHITEYSALQLLSMKMELQKKPFRK